MDKKLSFILPIYKVEAYLPKCVESILSQATEGCEIILVEDGSPDHCGVICDRYEQEQEIVRVIHKANGGLSSARNAGMALATGKYVLFVDSDDYIEEGSVEKILRWIDSTHADVAFLRTRKVFPDGTTEPLGENLVRERILGKSREEVLEFLAQCPKFPASAWGKIYRRDFLEEHGFRFPDDRRLSEDLQYSLEILLTAEVFDYLDFPYYCYRQSRAGSITNVVTSRYYFDTFLFVTEAADRLTVNKKAVDRASQMAMSFVAYEYAIRIWESLSLTGADRAQARKLLMEYQWVLKYGRSARTRLVRLTAGVFGLERTAKILNWYMTRE